MVPNLGHCHSFYPQQDDLSTSEYISSLFLRQSQGLQKENQGQT
ncbi:rCG61785, partial [Rattus norvegicus]